MVTFQRIFAENKRDIAIALTAVVVFFSTIPIITYIYFTKDLMSKESIMNKNDTGVTLFDSHGRPFFTFYQAKNKAFVPITQIPLYAQQAVIISEDREFYQHPGFSIRGIIRSIFINVRNIDIVAGGSTITQQLVKNALLSPQKSFLRKFQEIVLAQEIERRFKKNEILEMYLSSVYFGEGAFGIEEASRIFFAKHAKELTLAEATLLAALLPSPSELSPISGGKEKAFIRQKNILREMRRAGYISEQLEKKAVLEKITFQQPEESINQRAPHFALMVRNELIKKFGEENIARSGFKVTTTLNLDWQKFAEKRVRDHVEQLAPHRVTNGAAVVIEPKTGALKALVGSKSWHDDRYGKFNVATALRQPGSAFKPIVYAAALEKHIVTPATILYDQPTTFSGNYKPKNFDGKFRGPVTVRRALSNSLNVASVSVLEKVGIPNAIAMAKRLGITTLQDPSNYGLSLMLGAGEVKLIDLTSAYATFANKGIHNRSFTIMYIKDKSNRRIYEHNPTPKFAIDEQYAFLISSILSDSKTRAEVFGNALKISRPAAVKTGTTENFRDSLTIGYTPSITIGIWVGNNNGAPMDNIAGSLGAAPIWTALMEEFLQETPNETFTVPLGIVRQTICNAKNNVASISAGTEYFAQGTEPTTPCIPPTATPQLPTTSPSPTITSTQTITPTPTQTR